jgi:hypothetical protein
MAAALHAALRPPARRIRPGERPYWWDASADADAFDTWRGAASESGIGVDAWAALLVEFDLVLGDLGERPVAGCRLLSAAVRGDIARLGPATDLRQWLAEGHMACGIDELPELLLPERLACRLTPGERLSDRLRPERAGLALACDRQAALVGRTMESWALAIALSRRTGHCADRTPRLA